LSAMFGQIYTMYEGYFNINNVPVGKAVTLNILQGDTIFIEEN